MKTSTNLQARKSRLMPDGIPRYIRCYDNGGATLDRYTVAFTGRYSGRPIGRTEYVGMSAEPFHPQGFGQHGETCAGADCSRAGFAPAIGRKVEGFGSRIKFADLPPDCQKLVLSDYAEIWGLR